jgi:urease accessory protein
MFIAPTLQLERSHGVASLHLGQRRSKCAVLDLAQSGSAKVFLPRSNPNHPEAVFLNTSGGMTSGDSLAMSITLDSATATTATTQTAERAYKAESGPARVKIRADVGAGGWLDWLPQETILFEDSNLHRDTQIDLAMGATCLMCETVVLGRRAMGERPHRARLHDTRMVRIKGRPVWAENQRLDATILQASPSTAILRSNAAFAVLALIGPGAEAAAPALRDLPNIPDVEIGVSGWNGRTIVRLMAPDLWPLKQQLGLMIVTLTQRPLPRAWQMQGLTE